MRGTFLTASTKIVFSLLWFGVFRQDTFAELIADTKNAKDASPYNVYNVYNDDDVPFYNELEHLSSQETPHAIVQTIIHQTVYLPLQPSNPSSHIKDIFLGASPQKRDVAFSSMDKKTETFWPQESDVKSVGDSKTQFLDTSSPHLSFKDLLKSLQPAEIEQEEYPEPIIIFAPEDHDSYANMKDMHQQEIDSLFKMSSESDENGYSSLKTPKSQNSYKDLLLELSSNNNEASSVEQGFPSYASSFGASADSDKLIANPKVVESLSDDTAPSVGSDFTKPSALEKFLKSILPIFLSPASFDITFPGNETESRPLTETTANVGFNSK